MRTTATLLTLCAALALTACSAKRTLLSNTNSGTCATDIAFATLTAKDVSTGATIGAVLPNTQLRWNLALPASCTGTYTVQRVDSLGSPLSGSSAVQIQGSTSFMTSYATPGLVTERALLSAKDGSFAPVTISGNVTVSGSVSNSVCSVTAIPASIDVPLSLSSSNAPTIALGVSVTEAVHIVSVALVEDASKLSMDTFSGQDLTSQLITGRLSRSGTSKVRVTVAGASGQIVCPDASITLNPTGTPSASISLTANGLSGSPQFSGGSSVTVAWHANNASSCTITPSNLFGSSSGPHGTINVTVGNTVNIVAKCGSATANLSVVGDGGASGGFSCSAVASPSEIYLPGAPPSPFPALPVQFLVTTSSPSTVVSAQVTPAAPGMPGFVFAPGAIPAMPPVPGGTVIPINATIATPYPTVVRFYALGPDGNVVACDDATFKSTTVLPAQASPPRVILTANGFAGSLERPASGSIDFVWNSNAASCLLNFPAAQDAQPYPPNSVLPAFGKITLRADQIHGGGRYGIICLASGGARTDAYVDITVASYADNTCSLVASPVQPMVGVNTNLTLNITGPFDYALYDDDNQKILATPNVRGLGNLPAGAKSYAVTVFGPKGAVRCGSNFNVVQMVSCNVDFEWWMVYNGSGQAPIGQTSGHSVFLLPATAANINLALISYHVDDYYPTILLNGVEFYRREENAYNKLANWTGNLALTGMVPGRNVFQATFFNNGGPFGLKIRVKGTYQNPGSCPVLDTPVPAN